MDYFGLWIDSSSDFVKFTTARSHTISPIIYHRTLNLPNPWFANNSHILTVWLYSGSMASKRKGSRWPVNTNWQKQRVNQFWRVISRLKEVRSRIQKVEPPTSSTRMKSRESNTWVAQPTSLIVMRLWRCWRLSLCHSRSVCLCSPFVVSTLVSIPVGGGCLHFFTLCCYWHACYCCLQLAVEIYHISYSYPLFRFSLSLSCSLSFSFTFLST